MCRKMSTHSTSSEHGLPPRAPPTPSPLAASTPASRGLFLIVFLSGALLAITVTLVLPDALRAMREKRSQQELLFPAAEHLALIEDKDFYPVLPYGDQEECGEDDEDEAVVEGFDWSKVSTGLQKPKSREVSESPMECEAEALKTVQAATAVKDAKRARKLFRHAFALCPKHPTVLNQYGEFLERTSQDVVEADHLFVRAISFTKEGGIEHQRALANRKRTAVLIEEIDRKSLQRIQNKKKDFQKVSSSNAALKRAKKEAYFQHIYHSAGIEGNTMSLAQTRSILETKLAVAGKSVLEHNELLGLDSALKYINQTLVDKVGEITMDDILQIHKRVIGFVDPIEAGMMRRTQVYVGDYVPPHPTHIELLMQRFVLWLNSPHNHIDTHAIRYAALAHYKLVYIHPFVDGNGRTSRLLMNLILMQSGYPPVIIRKQDRLEYYQTLVTANEGDIRPFVRFIAECTERTLDAYLAATKDQSLGSRTRAADLVPFGMDDEDDHLIHSSEEDEVLKYHEKIILGGLVGDNITVEPGAEA